MRVLVTWGSKRGGTEGIARILGEALAEQGLRVSLVPPSEVRGLSEFDAVVVGGALYANRWHRAARRFVSKHAQELRSLPVWFFSSGPLDDSAERSVIAPTRQVRGLMRCVGARGHVTFGGRLLPDARGFPASAMAKKRAGDWRNHDHIRSWAHGIARAMLASPRPPARALVAKDPLRRTLAACCLFSGLTALVGGACLVARPDGSAVRLPLESLRHTPFHDYLIPGLVLALVVGGTNTVAGWLAARRERIANTAALASGALLAGWIGAEVALLRTLHWLQVVYFAIGLGILAMATFRRRYPRIVCASAH